DANREAALCLPALHDLEHAGITSGNAKRGEARAIDVLNELQRARFESIGWQLGHARGNRASRGDVASDDADRLPRGLRVNGAGKEVRRIGLARLDAELLQPAAVEEDLVVGLLQGNRIVWRDRVELFTSEWLSIVGELCRRPTTD